MKIALVHDYLNEAGGAERVLKVLSEMYPEAPIYTAFAKNGTAKQMFEGRQIIETKWAWLLKIGRMYSYLRGLIPCVWKSLDLREYDIIITSCSGYIARGFRVRDDAKIIAYCHAPPRWLYGYETPTGAQTKWWGKIFMFVIAPFVRYFDYKSAERVDQWIANSREVAGRIDKFYRKKAVVVYPPIEIKYSSIPVFQYSSELQENRKTGKPENEYYLMISRIVGGKGIEEAAYAFNKSGIKLRIVGEIVDRQLGARVVSEDRASDSELAELYEGARGFVALARDEDFGMTVVEAMSYGTPILAYNGGGYKETVVPDKTGILINGTDIKSVAEGIKRMEKIKWNHEEIKKWASQFSRANFEKSIRKVVGKYA